MTDRRIALRIVRRRYGSAFSLQLPIFGNLVVLSDPNHIRQLLRTGAHVADTTDANLGRVMGPNSLFRTVGRSAPRPTQAAHSAVSRSAARGVRGDRRSRGEQGVLGVAARSSVRDAARDDAHHAQRHLACHVRSRRRRVGAAAGNTARRNQTRIDAVVGSGAPMGLGPVESMGSVLPQSAGIRRIGGTAARHHPRGSAAPGRSSTSPSGRSRRRHWRSARGRCCRGRRSSPASACCTRTRRSFPTPIASTPTDSSPGRLTPPSGSRTAVAFVAASAPRLRPWRCGSYCEPCCATTQSARRVLAMRASVHAG